MEWTTYALNMNCITKNIYILKTVSACQSGLLISFPLIHIFKFSSPTEYFIEPSSSWCNQFFQLFLLFGINC